MKPIEVDFSQRLTSVRDLIMEAAPRGAIKIASIGETFTLKSGRKSRYFFNAGAFRGLHFVRLCWFYYQKMMEVGIADKVRIIYGPAYKGIPLCVGIHHEMGIRDYDIGFLFDRKEAKGHGDGGMFVGRAPSVHGNDKILMVDDVITDGATKLEAMMKLFEAYPHCEIIGLMVAFDRQEVALPDLGIPIWSLITASEYFGDAHPDHNG